MLASQIVGDEFAQAFKVLAVQFNVVVASTLHPEGLHCLRAALKEGQTMGEINDLILCAMDEEDGRGNPRHFIDAVEREKKEKNQDKKIRPLVRLVWLEAAIWYYS